MRLTRLHAAKTIHTPLTLALDFPFTVTQLQPSSSVLGPAEYMRNTLYLYVRTQVNTSAKYHISK